MKEDLKYFEISAGILLEGLLKDITRSVKILNCYGPYKYMSLFWKNMEDYAFLREEGLIIGGDINLTLSSREI
jgi:hypothetical protein